MAVPFVRTVKLGSKGKDCLAIKRALKKAKFGGGIIFTSMFGQAAVKNLKKFQKKYGLKADGVYDRTTHKKLSPYFDKFGIYLLKHTKISGQNPPLPYVVHFPNTSYPPTKYKYGLQPWIVPQVEAICERFQLQVSAGWGGHPPHAVYSDHRWGGAVDLYGPINRMVACNLWADKYMSATYKPGAVFRWVGGPAHDSSGVEPGHGDHVHLSWYRMGPATSVFNTPEFK